MTDVVLPPWRLVASTFERTGPDAWILVVRHEFYGGTRERSIEVYEAHLRADAFLRGCTQDHSYGAIECRTEITIEKHRA